MNWNKYLSETIIIGDRVKITNIAADTMVPDYKVGDILTVSEINTYDDFETVYCFEGRGVGAFLREIEKVY